MSANTHHLQRTNRPRSPGVSFGDTWRGYIFHITGGNDKQGFHMKQGVLIHCGINVPLAEGQSCFRSRRSVDRKRKSV
ncbi:ribosomal protein S6e-domain-containing protein [Lyophyllum atratum]|nr:ribosomal protein S6e-domain-containing protein [Lyophyllum atratum]